MPGLELWVKVQFLKPAPASGRIRHEKEQVSLHLPERPDPRLGVERRADPSPGTQGASPIPEVWHSHTRRSVRLPLPLRDLELRAELAGKDPQYTLAISPWADAGSHPQRGPSQSFVPCYPHQHQAGKLCLDKPTLIFMISRRLRAS